MPTFNRQLWRAAGQLDQFLKTRTKCSRPDPPSAGCYQQLQELIRRLRMVERNGWVVAARSVAMQLHGELFRCQAQITAALEIVSMLLKVEAIPNQALLYAELIALQTEFEDVEVNLQNGTLSAVTESIELDEVPLGRFRIILDWKSEPICSSPSPYRVEALDPSGPEYRSHITHPHVSSEQLCEGEAKSALRRALQDGRLSDYFQIINQVLHTYNSHSPYASLDAWGGTTCQDCGSNIPSDGSHCACCGGAMCDDCSTCCSICETSGCVACLSVCPGCESQICSDCSNACRECHKEICSECFNHTNDLCKDCDHVFESEEDEPSNSPTSEAPEADSEVQPASVGQVAVPSGPRPNGSRRFRRLQPLRSALRRRLRVNPARLLASHRGVR